MEVEAHHNLPHFHAYYQEHVAVFGIESGDLLAGDLPKRQCRLVDFLLPTSLGLLRNRPAMGEICQAFPAPPQGKRSGHAIGFACEKATELCDPDDSVSD